ncbi:hypothetical protein [Crocinitomix catalasitica]|uniref:hypothetical protein n=1 Tax=Crocinitomix catalasitica TaxID=184607 RepID=UPI0012F967F7|nr:hypothetical protein [Crocinitomix catalasitica]
MKKSLFILFITLTTHLFTQTDSLNWKLKLNECSASLGYIFQKEHVFEFGIKFDYYNQNKKFNIRQSLSLIAGAQLTSHTKTKYIAPFGTLRYLHPFSDMIGGVITTSYSFRKELGVNSNIITPEIGININQVATFSYGYNFFIDNSNPWLSHHRFALRLMFQ